MKDALGRDLVQGQEYGYSNTSNGITTIKAGKLIKVTEERATLEVTYAAKACYADDPRPDISFHSKTVSVKPNMIFPIAFSPSEE